MIGVSRSALRRKSERSASRSVTSAVWREEIAALRAELAMLREKHESLSALVRDTLNTTTDTLCTLADERREQRAEIDDLKLAVARLGASPEAKRAAFQFAREKSDVEPVDLPDFIRKVH